MTRSASRRYHPGSQNAERCILRPFEVGSAALIGGLECIGLELLACARVSVIPGKAAAALLQEDTPLLAHAFSRCLQEVDE